MKTLFLASLFISALFRSPVSIAEISKEIQASEFAKKVSQSKNWDQLIRNSLSSLPRNRIEEFGKFSQGQSYPAIVLKKNHFEISDENGARVEIKLYSHGVSALNQTKFKIHPLATIEDEVHRITETVVSKSNHTKAWSLIELDADAGIFSPGVALASHAITTGWAADQCGKGDLSEDQKASCPLMAVSMKTSGPDPVAMIPVGLTCPRNSSNGTLEMIDQSPHGTRRTRVVYADGNPISIELAGAVPGGSFSVLESFKIGSEKNDTEMDISQSISIQANSLKTGVCEGSSQDKKRYFASLSANAASLRNSQSNDKLDSSGSTNQAI